MRGSPAPGWGVVAVCALAATASCTHYQAAPLQAERSAERFAARTLAPKRDWNRAELLAVALQQNAELAVARAEMDAALSREISAAAATNPDLTLQSEYARHDSRPWLYGIDLNWPLRSGERRRLDREVARLDTGNAHLRLMDQAWSVRGTLAAALSNWEGARQRAGLLDQLSALQDRLIEVEQRRVRAGEDSPGGLITGQLARLQIDQQIAELRAVSATALTGIARALGTPAQALDGVSFDWQDWGEPPAVDAAKRQKLREQALLSRADLGVAMGAYASAEVKLQLAIARQYPQFTLSPGFYWDHGIAKFPFDVGFTLPLNGNRGEIAEARADRALAGQRMLALQADIYAQIESAERAESAARLSKEAAERRLAGVRRQLQQASLALLLGEADAHERMATEILAAQTELEVLDMRLLLQSARNQLEDVLHTPLSGPELILAGS